MHYLLYLPSLYRILPENAKRDNKMPRRKRNLVDRACYHITHRCHERKFLFRFAKYRNIYLKELFKVTRKYKIDVLNYVVTSNHIHLLVTANKAKNISPAMQQLHGNVGQQYNKHKRREGSFWSNRFHCTRIQSGGHLGKCMFYIELNMVRAGQVDHPKEWLHCGYHDLMGAKKRYRIINIDTVLNRLDIPDYSDFRKWYNLTLEQKLENRKELEREAFWSMSAAVGDKQWLNNVAGQIGFKRYNIVEQDDSLDNLETCYLYRKNR